MVNNFKKKLLSLILVVLFCSVALALEFKNPLTGEIIDESVTGVVISDYPFEYSKDAIKQKAIDVAKQIEIYLKSHPESTLEDLQNDEYFQEIAVQLVGETGYTAVTDYETLTCRFHKNPKIVDLNLESLSSTLPGFWGIMSKTRGGVSADGIYGWEEADGSIREKYMYIAIVSIKTADNVGLHVAATPYLDEYLDNEEGLFPESPETFLDKIKEYIPLIILTGILILAIGLAVWIKFRREKLGRSRVWRIGGFFLLLIVLLFSSGSYLISNEIKQESIESFIRERAIVAENKIGEMNSEIDYLENHLEYFVKKSEGLEIDSEEMDNLLKMSYEMKKDSLYAVYRINEEGIIENKYPLIVDSVNYEEIMKKDLELDADDKAEDIIVGNVFDSDWGFKGINLYKKVTIGGKPEGFVSFFVDLDNFFYYIESLRGIRDGEVYILDENNNLIYRSIDGDGEMNPSEVKEIAEAIEKGFRTTASVLFEYHSVEKVAIGTSIENGGKLWHLLLIFDSDEAYKSVSSRLNVIFIITIATIICIVLLALFLVYQLTQSLRKDVEDKTVQLKEFNKKLERTVLERTKELAKKSTELKNVNFGLEKEVLRRTKELNQKVDDLSSTKKALLNMMEDEDKANEELKKLDKSKSEFLNIISHELKTPLTAIIAYLDVLADARKNPTPEEAESLEAIARNSRSLKRLIGNILEIARMESGKFELTKQKADINPIVEETLNDIKSIADKKKLKLINRVKGVPEIEVDVERFREIIINLVGNAIKFTDKGSVTVSATPKEDFVEFRIQDTGVGIPESHLNELFEKFYQVDASISRKYGGTGLGLAITKKIIEAHGGKIVVKSVEGKGTTFIINLPIKGIKSSKNGKNKNGK